MKEKLDNETKFSSVSSTFSVVEYLLEQLLTLL